MKRNQPSKFIIGLGFLLLTLGFLPGLTWAQGGGAYSIVITQVPPVGGGPNRTEMIAGEVRGESPNDYRIVIFAHADMWYVQPYVAAPFTSIGKDGRWKSNTHLGHEYAALLVKPSYKPPATTIALPAIGGDVLAVEVVPASDK